MSAYPSRVTGRIMIMPAIPWSLVKGGPFDPKTSRRDVVLRLREVESDGGDTVRRVADAVVPLMSDSYGAYFLVEHLQELIDEFGRGREFVGHLYREGADSLDVARLVVRGGRAVEVRPVITWPDEDGA